MIHVIYSCIAVFLEYSSIHRMYKYNCNDEFTTFLAHDFIQMLYDTGLWTNSDLNGPVGEPGLARAPANLLFAPF